MWKLLTIFLLLAPRLSAQAASAPDGDRGRILSLENAWNQAVQQQDTKALGPLLAEELIYIDYDGAEMNKAQYLASLNATALHFEHIVSESMRVQSYGQSAVVVGVYLEKGTKNGKPYLHRERFVNTWINRKGAWMCVASQSTLILH